MKKLSRHPILPYYLTGSSDGAIKIYEFNEKVPIQEPRPAGVAARPTQLLFNNQGNKFGVTDVEGNLSLFQVGFGTNTTSSYLTMSCHNKHTSDFVFISSSSFLATAGYSSDGNNVCFWDTLLPARCSLVQCKLLAKLYSSHIHIGLHKVIRPIHHILLLLLYHFTSLHVRVKFLQRFGAMILVLLQSCTRLSTSCW